jgi:hypothetical protein
MALTWNGDLSPGNDSQYGPWAYGGTGDGTPPISQRITVASSIDGFTPCQGNYLMRIQVAPGDQYFSTTGWRTVSRLNPPSGNPRTHPFGNDCSYTWATLVPSGWPWDANIFNSGWEWHQTDPPGGGVTGVAPKHFIIRASEMYVDVRGGSSEATKQTYVSQTFLSGYQKGAWYVFTERYVQNQAPNGHYELWYGKVGTHTSMVQLISAPNIGTVYGSQLNYPSFGTYRGQSGTATTSLYIGGAREYTTLAEAKAWGVSILTGSAPPPPTPTFPSNTQDRRFGKDTVGTGRLGFTADRKRASKFATGLNSDEEGDVKDMHLFVEGADNSSGTQRLALGIYADDAGGGAPGTKFGEEDTEIVVAGNATASVQSISVSPAIRIRGANAWLAIGAGAPDNRLFYAADTAVTGRFFNDDIYDASAPRLSDPFGTGTTDDGVISIAADYDIVSTSPSGTAPVFDASSKSENTNTASLSWSHTCSGSDRCLVVSVVTRGAQTVTGVTYNAVALTLIGATANSSIVRVEQWRLVAPATGSNTIAVTLANAATTVEGFGVSYTGVHQTSPTATSTGATGNNDTPTVTIASATDERVVDVIGQKQDPSGAEALTVGASQTSRGEESTTNGATIHLQGGVSEEQGAVSTTMSWTGHDNVWAIRATGLKPTVGTSPPGDTTAPALTSADTDSNGEELQLVYDEPLNENSLPAVSDYEIRVNGVVRVVTSVDIVTQLVSSVILTPAFAFVNGDTITVSYTRVAGREVKDLAGNLAANLTTQAVTNETAVESVPLRVTTIAHATTTTRTSTGERRVGEGGGGG